MVELRSGNLEDRGCLTFRNGGIKYVSLTHKDPSLKHMLIIFPITKNPPILKLCFCADLSHEFFTKLDFEDLEIWVESVGSPIATLTEVVFAIYMRQ